MTRFNDTDPDFNALFARSEELLSTAKLKRESESVDWREVHQLHNEIDRLADEMTAMLPPTPMGTS